MNDEDDRDLLFIRLIIGFALRRFGSRIRIHEKWVAPCNEAGLPHFTAHNLRHHRCRERRHH
jgi:integrase